MRSEETTTDTPQSPDLESRGSTGLTRRLGTVSVMFAVLAFLAPLGAASGYLPLIVGYGNGSAAPITFLLVSLGLLIFSVGYTTLTHHVPNPGAFYAYTTAGLGKRIGLGSSFLSITFYGLNAIGFYVYGGIAFSQLITSFGGPTLSWWVGSAILFVFVSALAYRGIDLNIRVMALVLIVEVTLLLVFTVVNLGGGGAEGVSLTPFDPTKIGANGSLVLAIVFSLALYPGFESCAVYAEEARDPRRTIPRATFGTIAFIAIFYALVTWAYITHYGSDRVLEAAAKDPAGSFVNAFSESLGTFAGRLLSVLIITSVLASQLSIANVSSRYVYSLGVDRVISAKVARTHPKYRSPAIASVVVAVTFGLVLLVVTFAGIDPTTAYAAIGGDAVIAFLAMLILVSAAVIVFFRRNRTDESPLKTLVAPLFGLIVLVPLFIYSIKNLSLLVGADYAGFATVLLIIVFAAILGGILYASWLSKARPDTYRRLGRSAE